jgi:hypothetical protein
MLVIGLTLWGVSGFAGDQVAGRPSASADGLTNAPFGRTQAAETIDNAQVAPEISLLCSDGSESGLAYFGVPLEGRTIGYVVDGDETMAPYIDRLAFITNTVITSMEPGEYRFGVVQAVGRDGRTFIEVYEPSSDLAGASAVLRSRLPGGKTDLSRALSAATNWYADQVFLVLSKPVEPQQLTALRQDALQTGAVTHVIALGEAAKVDLSPISASTGGRFIRVSDTSMQATFNHCRKLAETDGGLP